MTTLLQSTQNTTVAFHKAGGFVPNSKFSLPLMVEVDMGGFWAVDSTYHEWEMDDAKSRLFELRNNPMTGLSPKVGKTARLIRLSAVVVE